jgi:Zn-finger nucleic acid-binding protein/ribosomal protein L40E
MRLLVACSNCERQYDASGRKPGSRFRCHCGEVVVVEEPKGHDASVVRCSSCGAPREERAAGCRFCGADFTLRERDLHTVCPKCLARVSDRARFCHHCGQKLMPEAVAGENTDLACPACGESYQLTNRQIGDVAVLECGGCAGLWLGNQTFKHLTEKASAGALDVDQLFHPVKQAAPAGPADAPLNDDWRYRKCPSCNRMMHRRNYGRRSGVIIDLCKTHGVWLDADELPRILNWIRSGGKAEAKRRREAEEDRQERRERATKSQSDRGPVMGVPLGGSGGYSGSGGFLDEIFTWFFRY